MANSHTVAAAAILGLRFLSGLLAGAGFTAGNTPLVMAGIGVLLLVEFVRSRVGPWFPWNSRLAVAIGTAPPMTLPAAFVLYFTPLASNPVLLWTLAVALGVLGGYLFFAEALSETSLKRVQQRMARLAAIGGEIWVTCAGVGVAAGIGWLIGAGD